MVASEEEDFPEEAAPAEEAKRHAADRPPIRFTIVRLIIATAMTPWPFLALPERSEPGKVALLISAMALAGAVLIIRAVDLPRVNLTATLFLIFMAVMEFIMPRANSILGVCINAVLAAIPTFLYTAATYPQLDVKRRATPPAKAISVLRTALLPYLLMFMAQAAMSALLIDHQPLPPIERELVLLITIVSLLLFVFNLYVLLIAGASESLEDRPELGYLFQFSMVLIPLAIVTYFARTYWITGN